MRSVPRLLSLLAIPAFLAGAAVLATSAPASAAVVSGAVQNVVITPTNPAQGSQLRTDISWCVPNGSRAGDTFTLRLDPHMRRLPEGFQLNDPKTGVEVASAAITGTTPDAAIVTFTLTDYAESHTGVCGTAFVSADFDGLSTPTGQPTPFTSVTNDGKTFTTTITPTGPVPADLTQASKYGTWTNDDQGKTDPTDFIVWNIDTPNGAFDSARTVDTVPAGERWTFDCDTVFLYDGAVDAQGDYVPTADVTDPVPFTCTDTEVAVDWPAQQAGERFRLRVSASMATPFGSDAAPATFSNDAAVTTTTADVPTNFETSASLTQATSGGQGSGTAITAPPVTPPVTTPPVTTPPAAQPLPNAVVATPIAATPVSGATTRALAYTGSDDTVGLWAGGGMLALGLVLALLARRRRVTTRR